MKLLFTLFTLFIAGAQYGQAILNNIELTIRQDLTPPAAGAFIVNQGFTAYSVYARPIQDYSSQYDLGNTQITVALPKGLTYWASTFSPNSVGSLWVDSDQGGTWINQDVVEDEASLSMDYHAVASTGRTMNGSNPLTAGTEYRMYTIYVQGACDDNIRLFINGTDPDSGSMPGGGDFNNNFIHQVAAGNFPDEYSNNYTSGTPTCLPVLPVELVDFNVIKDGSDALLIWQTTTEVNNDYFEVQRSANGKTWETIGMVNGAGTTTISQNYKFTDDNPVMGVNYYRLEQFDLNGASYFSDIKKLEFEEGSAVLSVNMYPNPTIGFLRISSNKQLDDHIVVVSDVTGKVLYSYDYVNGSDIDLRKLNPGMYLVKVKNQRGEVITTQRIIKSSE